MAVKPGTIENREQDLTVDNRVVSGGRSEKAGAEEQLNALRQRIRAGMNNVGDDSRRKEAPACVECFQRGWLAAMKSLSTE